MVPEHCYSVFKYIGTGMPLIILGLFLDQYHVHVNAKTEEGENDYDDHNEVDYGLENDDDSINQLIDRFLLHSTSSCKKNKHF